jgi:hypothetical protein
MPGTKRCIGCGRELPLSEFHFRSQATGERQSRCRTCVNQNLRKRRAQKRESLLPRDLHGPGQVTVVIGPKGARYLRYPCEVCGKLMRYYESEILWHEARGTPRPRTCSQRCGGILRRVEASRSEGVTA